jgi:hypothetical protein
METTKNDEAPAPANDLEFHASGFVVKVGGSWTDVALEQFSNFLKTRGIDLPKEELLPVLEQTKRNFLAGSCRLFLCNAPPCHAKIGFDISPEALDRAHHEFGVPVSLTGCQGPCKQAPILSLRVGHRAEFFAQVTSAADWAAILSFAGRAAAAGTLQIDAGPAGFYRFDPVHEATKPSLQLQRLQFLLGHFQGEGKFSMTPYTFQKEVIGTFEAGGRFIALRMDASYPLADGRKDVHKALVVVGSEPPTGVIRARAYTDGGLVRDYAIDSGEGHLRFDDVPPGHGKQWQRARKILSPTEYGFEERLEVENSEGTFLPYYSIAMRKVAP